MLKPKRTLRKAPSTPSLSFGRGCSWVPSERLDRHFFLSGFLPSPLLVISELCCLLAFSTFFPYLIFFPAAAARAAAACMLVTAGYVVQPCSCSAWWLLGLAPGVPTFCLRGSCLHPLCTAVHQLQMLVPEFGS